MRDSLASALPDNEMEIAYSELMTDVNETKEGIGTLSILLLEV